MSRLISDFEFPCFQSPRWIVVVEFIFELRSLCLPVCQTVNMKVLNKDMFRGEFFLEKPSDRACFKRILTELNLESPKSAFMSLLPILFFHLLTRNWSLSLASALGTMMMEHSCASKGYNLASMWHIVSA